MLCSRLRPVLASAAAVAAIFIVFASDEPSPLVDAFLSQSALHALELSRLPARDLTLFAGVGGLSGGPLLRPGDRARLERPALVEPRVARASGWARFSFTIWASSAIVSRVGLVRRIGPSR